MRQTTNYSESIKAAVLTKLMAINGPSMVELTKEFNIPSSTIHSWKKNMLKKQVINSPNIAQRPNEKSPEFKLQAVIDTLGKTTEEQSAYCRAQGIYSNHLDTWKKEMLAGLGASLLTAKTAKAEIQKLTNEIKQLKKNLHRKDKALAEVSALLILKKKADLLWGVEEDAP